MKLQYDDLVVGSGVSGMTVSLLLAGTGRRVLLLEKAMPSAAVCSGSAGTRFLLTRDSISPRILPDAWET